MDSPPFSPSSSEEEEGDSFTSEIFSVTSDGSLIARFLRTDLLEILCRVNVGALWADFFVAECIARALFEANNANDADDDARGEVAIISLKLSVFFVYTKVLSLSLSENAQRTNYMNSNSNKAVVCKCAQSRFFTRSRSDARLDNSEEWRSRSRLFLGGVSPTKKAKRFILFNKIFLDWQRVVTKSKKHARKRKKRERIFF